MSSRDENRILESEIQGLRFQLASKEEVLERCLVEIESLLRQVQIQKEELSEKETTVRDLVSKVASLEAKLQGKSARKTGQGSSLYVPLSGKDTKTKKQDLSASCKITMRAKVANDT